MNSSAPHQAPRFQTKSEPAVLLKLALAQIFWTIVFSAVLYYCFDAREALSALFGGIIASIASVYSAVRLFTARSGSDPQEILIRFYISVVIKVLFTLAMMAICIIVIKVSLLPFIIAYLLAAVVINLLFLLVPQAEAV